MTRQLTAALRRALASGRKVLGPSGASSRPLDEDLEEELEEEDLAPPERPLSAPEEAEPEEIGGGHRPPPPPRP